MRTEVLLGLYWGPLILGNCQIDNGKEHGNYRCYIGIKEYIWGYIGIMENKMETVVYWGLYRV